MVASDTERLVPVLTPGRFLRVRCIGTSGNGAEGREAALMTKTREEQLSCQESPLGGFGNSVLLNLGGMAAQRSP